MGMVKRDPNDPSPGFLGALRVEKEWLREAVCRTTEPKFPWEFLLNGRGDFVSFCSPNSPENVDPFEVWPLLRQCVALGGDFGLWPSPTVDNSVVVSNGSAPGLFDINL